MRTWDNDWRLLGQTGQGLIIARSSDFEWLSLEVDAVERHGLCRLIHRAELRNKRDER